MSDGPAPPLARRLASGAGMMVLMRLGERMIGLVSFSITARLLLPADFGIFALAISVLAIVEPLGRAGIDLALIQRRDAERSDFDAAWSANVLIGAAIATILCVIAVPASIFFKEPRVALIVYWIAAAVVIAGFENIGTVQFRKSLDFRKEMTYRVLVRAIAAAATVGAVLAWRDFTALIVGYVAGKIGLVGLSYVLQPYRPRFSLAGITRIVVFSKWVLLRNIIASLNDQAATFTIGRLLHVDALAFFSAAREIATLATTEISAPVQRALYPGFAMLGGDRVAFRRLYLDATGMSAMLGLPIPVGLSVIAADFVRLLLGPQWLPAAPLIPILVLVGIMSCFTSGTQIVFLGLGRPRVTAFLAAARFALLIPALLIGAHAAGTMGVAWAIVAISTVMFLVNGFQVRRALEMRKSDQWRVCYRPIAASALMYCAVAALQTILPADGAVGTVAFRLVASVAVGAVAYAAALFIAWLAANCPDGAERHALGAVQTAWKRLRTAPDPSPA